MKIARPYAKAIFEIARNTHTLEPWSVTLKKLAAVVQNKEMSRLIKNPNVSKEQLYTLIIEMAGSITPLAPNLVQLLIKFHRLRLIPDISELYEQMKYQAEKVVKVTLTTAVPVDEAYTTRLTQVLAQRLTGKIELEQLVDKTILGGAILQAGDKVVDGSIRGKLAKLSDTLGIY